MSDDLDRVTKEIAPDKSARLYSYDDQLNLLEATNANGSKLVYRYDGLGNLVKVYQSGESANLVEMQYDDNENMISETDGNQNLKKIAYDELTRITQVQRTDKTGSVLADTRVTYDESYKPTFGGPFMKVTGSFMCIVNPHFANLPEKLCSKVRAASGFPR